MPRVDWVSNGRKLDKYFMNWLVDTPTLIIPNFRDVIFPHIRFTDKKKLVTLCWEKNTFYNNVNRLRFPDVKEVINVGYTPLIGSHYPLQVTYMPQASYFMEKNQIRWTEDEWVNEEWLESQFNEFFARFQTYQNELRKPLK
jgi:hypothetical protein